MDNLFDVNDEYLEMAQAEDGSITRLVQVLETQLQNVEVPLNDSYRQISDNIAVEVRNVEPEAIGRGISFGSFLLPEADGVTMEEVVKVLEDRDLVIEVKPASIVLIILPQSLVDNLGN